MKISLGTVERYLLQNINAADAPVDLPRFYNNCVYYRPYHYPS